MSMPRNSVLSVREAFERMMFALLLAAVLTLYAAQVFMFPIDDDVSWFLHALRRMWEGEVLYRDIAEPNPPLILLLYAPPLFIADALGVNPANVINGVILFLAWMSAVAAAHILRYSIHHFSGLQRRWMFLACLAVLLAVPGVNVIAQREHIFILLILPYVFLHLPSVRANPTKPSAPLLLLCAAAAALGFYLKPYFLIVWLALLLWDIKRSRSLKILFSSYHMLMVCIGMLYSAVMLAVFPEYLRYLPLWLETYSAYTRTAANIFMQQSVYFLLALLALFLPLGKRILTRFDLTYLAVLVLAAFINVVVQGKLWLYSFYPVHALAFLTLSYGLISGSAPTLARLAFGCLCLCLYMLPLRLMGYGAIMEQDKKQQAIFRGVLETYAANRAIFVLGNETYPWFPLMLQTSARWGHRYSLMLMLPGIYHDDGTLTPRPGKEDQEREVLNALYEDFMRKNPALLIVFAGDVPPGQPRPPFWDFDFKGWLQKDPRFAEILLSWQYLTRLPGPCIPSDHCAPHHYDVYVRP